MKFKSNQPIVLASGSPRRKELLEGLGIKFSIVPSKKAEPAPKDFKTATDYVLECARQKAKEVARSYPDSVVIGSDTVVVLEGEILLKPKDKEQARNFLERLSGNTHDVITALAIIKGNEEQSFHETTQVTFYELEDSWIEAYICTEDPYDKAGAYGIQTMSRLFVKEIKGDYNTVVGLPVASLARKLAQSGFIALERSGVHADF